jgi:hypothetical protein
MIFLNYDYDYDYLSLDRSITITIYKFLITTTITITKIIKNMASDKRHRSGMKILPAMEIHSYRYVYGNWSWFHNIQNRTIAVFTLQLTFPIVSVVRHKSVGIWVAP